MAVLVGLGCDLIQGWHVGRPMAIDQLREFFDGVSRIERPSAPTFDNVVRIGER